MNTQQHNPTYPNSPHTHTAPRKFPIPTQNPLNYDLEMSVSLLWKCDLRPDNHSLGIKVLSAMDENNIPYWSFGFTIICDWLLWRLESAVVANIMKPRASSFQKKEYHLFT